MGVPLRQAVGSAGFHGGPAWWLLGTALRLHPLRSSPATGLGRAVLPVKLFRRSAQLHPLVGAPTGVPVVILETLRRRVTGCGKGAWRRAELGAVSKAAAGLHRQNKRRV